MLIRKLLAWWAGLLTIASGISLGGLGLGTQNTRSMPSGCLGYFVGYNHPALSIVSAQISTGQYANPGEKITVTALTNQPTNEASLQLLLCDYYASQSASQDVILANTDLRDDGQQGDLIAGDGEWYGECICPGPFTSTVLVDPQVIMNFKRKLYREPYDPDYYEPSNFFIYKNTPQNSSESNSTNKE